MEEDRLLRIEEVAHRLGYSSSRIRRLITGKGVIPYTRIGSRDIRVRKSDLDAYIATLGHREEPKKEEAKEKPKEKPAEVREPFEGRQSLYKEGE